MVQKLLIILIMGKSLEESVQSVWTNWRDKGDFLLNLYTLRKFPFRSSLDEDKESLEPPQKSTVILFSSDWHESLSLSLSQTLLVSSLLENCQIYLILQIVNTCSLFITSQREYEICIFKTNTELGKLYRIPIIFEQISRSLTRQV